MENVLSLPNRFRLEQFFICSLEFRVFLFISQIIKNWVLVQNYSLYIDLDDKIVGIGLCIWF